MRERTEWDATAGSAPGSAERRSERRRPQVEVIREPNPIDEAELVEPASSE
jgi:hypothetical protein